MAGEELARRVAAQDPATSLRAAGALRRLAEQIEASAVEHARQEGWPWEQIGDALGISRQSIHTKYGK